MTEHAVSRDSPGETPRPDVPTVYEWAGGLAALERMTEILYGTYVPRDPLLAPLFATAKPDHPKRVAAWLAEVFGGPSTYSERHGGYAHMVGEHVGKALTEEQRSRWVELVCRAADDASLPDDPAFRAAFVSYLEWGSRLAKENSAATAQPARDMPMPRWTWVCEAYPSVPAANHTTGKKEQVTTPRNDETVSFALHIKPLLRDRDRQSMRFAFDLSEHADVAANADAILKRLRAGTMPCDAAWPAERINVFERWIRDGKPV